MFSGWLVVEPLTVWRFAPAWEVHVIRPKIFQIQPALENNAREKKILHKT